MASADFKDDDKTKILRRPLTRKLSLRRSVLEYNLCRVQGNQQSTEVEDKLNKSFYSLRSNKDVLLPSDVDPLMAASTPCPPRSTFLKNLFPKWKQSEPHQWVPAKEKNGFQSEEMKSFPAYGKASPGSCTLRRVGSVEQLNHLPDSDGHSFSMDSDVPPPSSRGLFGLRTGKRTKDSKHAKKFHTFTFPRLLKRKSKTVVGNGGLLCSEAPCAAETLIATSYNELENSPPAKKGRVEDSQTTMEMELDLPPPAPAPRRRASTVRMSSDIMCE